MESGEVCIVVRSVYEAESLELKVALNERISAVKSRVQRLLRSQPEPNRQRLIFCGKICGDDDEIADVLGKVSFGGKAGQIEQILAGKWGIVGM